MGLDRRHHRYCRGNGSDSLQSTNSFTNSSSYQMSSRRHACETCICSLIRCNSYFVLYLMCCFGNNPLYMDLKPIKMMFCSFLALLKSSTSFLSWGRKFFFNPKYSRYLYLLPSLLVNFLTNYLELYNIVTFLFLTLK